MLEGRQSPHGAQVEVEAQGDQGSQGAGKAAGTACPSCLSAGAYGQLPVWSRLHSSRGAPSLHIPGQPPSAGSMLPWKGLTEWGSYLNMAALSAPH